MKTIGNVVIVALLVSFIVCVNKDYDLVGYAPFGMTRNLWNNSAAYVVSKVAILGVLPLELGAFIFLSPAIVMLNITNPQFFWNDIVILGYAIIFAGGVLFFRKLERRQRLNAWGEGLRSYIETGFYKGGISDQVMLCRYILDNSAGRYNAELSITLGELVLCYNNGAILAFMALAGRALEIILKQIMIFSDVAHEEHWMIGDLIAHAEKVGVLNPESELTEWVGVINHYRVAAVHVKSEMPRITQNQREVIFFALMHLIWYGPVRQYATAATLPALGDSEVMADKHADLSASEER